jgi:hypothetical protein
MTRSRPTVRLVLAAAALLYLSPAFADDVDPGTSLERVRRIVAASEVKRLEVFFLSYEVRTRVAVTPDDLPKWAERKISVAASPELMDGLRTAFNDTKIHRIDHPPDLRWGAIFYGAQDAPLFSIYLDGRYVTGTGRKGYIDTTPVGLNDALIRWFEGNFL